MNSTGPKTDPCGTPLLTFSHPDATPLTTILCLLSDKQFSIHLTIPSSNPILVIFNTNFPCDTLSKAVWKSRYTASTALPEPHSPPPNQRTPVNLSNTTFSPLTHADYLSTYCFPPKTWKPKTYNYAISNQSLKNLSNLWRQTDRSVTTPITFVSFSLRNRGHICLFPLLRQLLRHYLLIHHGFGSCDVDVNLKSVGSASAGVFFSENGNNTKGFLWHSSHYKSSTICQHFQ